MIDIYSMYAAFSFSFRRKRMKIFVNLFNPLKGKRILDVGGNVFNQFLPKHKPKLTVLNIKFPKELGLYEKNNVEFILGNGLCLPFKDNSFDIIYSNSVIEHLGTWKNQMQFAKEIIRVGKNIFIQTPNKYFFIEPHLLTPFIHYLPKRIQRKLLRNFTIWGLIARPSQQYCMDHIINEIRLLSCNELRRLFPSCHITRERFVFFTKSFYIVRKD